LQRYPIAYTYGEMKFFKQNINKHIFYDFASQKKLKQLFFKFNASNFADMKAVIQYVMIWAMLAAILVGTTGFRLVKHSCNSCGIVEVTLTNPNPCCTSKTFPKPKALISCCSLEGEHISCTSSLIPETCCEIKSLYFTTEDVVQPKTFRLEQEIVAQSSFEQLYDWLFDKSFLSTTLDIKVVPPLIFSGTEYLAFLQQFKIPAC